MEFMDVFKRVGIVFKKVFDDRELDVCEDTSAGDIGQWKSLNHVILISEIEKEFNIKFGLSDMLEITTVRDICNKIISLSSSV